MIHWVIEVKERKEARMTAMHCERELERGRAEPGREATSQSGQPADRLPLPFLYLQPFFLSELPPGGL